MSFTYHFQVDATLVSNEFIDRYLAEANGEYVKVYLYLLRHRGEPVSLERIAEGLNHTEADIRRAIAYWEKLGVLSTGTDFAAQQAMGAAGSGGKAGDCYTADHRSSYGGSSPGTDKGPAAGVQPGPGEPPAGRRRVLGAFVHCPALSE